MRASAALHDANQARGCITGLRPLKPGRFAAAFNQQRQVGKLLPPTLLAEITPHSLPVPIGRQTTSADGVVQFQHGAAKQTLQRFLDIFNAAGTYLHVPNPLAFETLADFQVALDAARGRVEVELQYLKAVLWKHAKIGLAFDGVVDSPKQAGNPDNAWLVDFGNPDSDDIQMLLASSQVWSAP